MNINEFTEIIGLLERAFYDENKRLVFTDQSLKQMLERLREPICTDENFHEPGALLEHWDNNLDGFRNKLIEESLTRKSLVELDGKPVPLVTAEILELSWCPDPPVFGRSR